VHVRIPQIRLLVDVRQCKCCELADFQQRSSSALQVSSVELERVCAKNAAGILETAAVAVPEPGGGPDSLVMFVVPSQPGSCQDLPDVKKRCQLAIRELNPLFKLNKVGIYNIFASAVLLYFFLGKACTEGRGVCSL